VPYVFPLASITGLLDDLAAVEVRASIDPAKVNPPGCWLHVLGPLRHDTLAGSQLDAELILVVGDTTDEAALTNLAALHDRVLDVIGAPDGPIRLQGTILPGPDLTPLPSLVVPVIITN
jgi:hypothetical protein